jgi:hypothetical protein
LFTHQPGCHLLFLSWHVDAAATATVCYFCYTEAIDRTLERTLEFSTLTLRICMLQAVLSTAAGSFGAGLVNLLGMLCRVGQYRHGVLEHFEEATRDEEWFLFSTELDPQLAGDQQCQQSGVLRQNTDPSFCAGGADQIGLAIIQFALGGYYLDMKDMAPFCHRFPLLFFFLVALLDLIDVSCHVEEVFAGLIELAIENFLEATDGFL